MRFILTFGEGEYVESYSLTRKEVFTGDKKDDAIKFEDKLEADYASEILGCMVIEI